MNSSQQSQIDPTKNVLQLVEASIKRIDDLADIRYKNTEEKIHEKDIQYQIQFTSAKEAVAAALDGTKEAINKADINTDKRFDLLSEKIDGITTTMNKNSGERGIYVTHIDLNIAMDKLQGSIEATLRPVVAFMNSQTGKTDGADHVWVIIVGAVGFVSTLISIVAYFLKQ